MKTLLAFFSSAIILASSLPGSRLLLDYQLNRDFYEKHCINKQRPETNCHGKCQLTKEITDTSGTFNFIRICFEFNFLEGNIQKVDLNISRCTHQREKYPFLQPEWAEINLKIPNPPPLLRV